jgi:hypothetical protein
MSAEEVTAGLETAKRTLRESPFSEIQAAFNTQEAGELAVQKLEEARELLAAVKEAMPSFTLSAYSVKERAQEGSSQIQAAVGKTDAPEISRALTATEHMAEEAGVVGESLDTMETMLGEVLGHIGAAALKLDEYQTHSMRSMIPAINCREWAGEATTSLDEYIEHLI